MHQNNIGLIDRLGRIILAELIIMFAWFWTGRTWQIIFYIIGAILTLTAIFGFCGLYEIFGFNTNKNNPKNKKIIFLIFVVVFLIIALVLGRYWDIASTAFYVSRI